MKMYGKELKPGIALAEQRLFLSFLGRIWSYLELTKKSFIWREWWDSWKIGW